MIWVISFVLAILAASDTYAIEEKPKNWRTQRGFPFGIFPHVDSVSSEGLRAKDHQLSDNLVLLSESVENTVQLIVEKKTNKCFNHDCLIQGIPLAFDRPSSGFWGGLKLKITDISRRNPSLWSTDLYAVRSDSKQWVTRGSLDFPQISWIPFHPRIKFRGRYSRSKEARFYGEGVKSNNLEKRHDNAIRYDLRSAGYDIYTDIHLGRISNINTYIFSQYLFKKQTNRPIVFDDSVLFQERPLGVAAPYSSTIHTGLIFETLERDKLPTRGWSHSWGYAVSLPKFAGRYRYHRMTLIDKRYFRIARRVIMAHRLTFDKIFGDSPYWELSAVGGPEPVQNIASSDLLRIYPSGRFHEKEKNLSSSEMRWHLQPIRVFNQSCEPVIVPFGFNFGYFKGLTALSAHAGSHLLCNNNFIIQAMGGYSKMGPGIEIEFGENF